MPSNPEITVVGEVVAKPPLANLQDELLALREVAELVDGLGVVPDPANGRTYDAAADTWQESPPDVYMPVVLAQKRWGRWAPASLERFQQVVASLTRERYQRLLDRFSHLPGRDEIRSIVAKGYANWQQSYEAGQYKNLSLRDFATELHRLLIEVQQAWRARRR